MMNLQLLNEAQIVNEWAPMLESVGVSEGYKKNWMSKYCHYHQMNESYINESSAFSGTGLAQLINVPGQGPVNLGTATGVSPANFYNTSYQGSGDKFPSLLPLAIQVAAKTIGFDIVSVIPMPGPTGILPYLDYIYAGGKTNTTGAGANPPLMISIALDNVFTDTAPNPDEVGPQVGDTYFALPLDAAAATASSTGYAVTLAASDAAKLVYVGKSFVTGDAIFRVLSTGTITSAGVYTGETDGGVSIAEAFGVGGSGYASIVLADSVGTSDTTGTADNVVIADANGNTPGYVSALENHIYGFSGAGNSDTNTWNGPFTDGTKAYDPMSRGTGEQTYPRAMGIQTFTKNVQAGTFQVTISVTTEQIQDMNRQFGIDILAMAEGVLVNEVSQSINKHILSRAFALGWQNNYDVYQTQGFTLNLTVDPTQTASAGTTPSFIGKNDTGLSWSGNVPVYANYGGFENLSTAQQRVVSKIHAASNLIHTRGRRGPANFVITNAQILSALNIVKGFSLAPFDNTLNQSSGQLYPAGTLFGMTVYVDPNMTWDDTRVLVGRKGADIEPGIKFMPYLMAESISTIAEGTMSPKIAVKSRYALVEAGFYPEAQYYCFYVDVPASGIA